MPLTDVMWGFFEKQFSLVLHLPETIGKQIQKYFTITCKQHCET